jgi:hypothetical protein
MFVLPLAVTPGPVFRLIQWKPLKHPFNRPAFDIAHGSVDGFTSYRLSRLNSPISIVSLGSPTMNGRRAEKVNIDSDVYAFRPFTRYCRESRSDVVDRCDRSGLG